MRQKICYNTCNSILNVVHYVYIHTFPPWYNNTAVKLVYYITGGILFAEVMFRRYRRQLIIIKQHKNGADIIGTVFM